MNSELKQNTFYVIYSERMQDLFLGIHSGWKIRKDRIQNELKNNAFSNVSLGSNSLIILSTCLYFTTCFMIQHNKKHFRAISFYINYYIDTICILALLYMQQKCSTFCQFMDSQRVCCLIVYHRYCSVVYVLSYALTQK